MAARDEERKNSEAPVKLIAKIEELGALSNVEEAKRNGETGGGGGNRGGDSKGVKKAIIVEKSTGAPLVTVRSRRSIMESRFRLTLKTWDDVWRSTSWAKNPPKQIRIAAAIDAADESPNGRVAVLESTAGRVGTAARDVDVDDADAAVVAPSPLSGSEETLRKTVSDTNVQDRESANQRQMVHVATDDDIAVRDREASGRVAQGGPDAAEMGAEADVASPAEAVPAATRSKAVREAADADEVDAGGGGDETGESCVPLPKKIKNTRFMVVPSVQVPPPVAAGPADGDGDVEREEAAGTAASSDSEDASSSNQNSASRNRVPMFESRLNELTMVESQLKKLDFKPMHLEPPDDRDSDDSANSKTITAAEGKTIKIRDALPPRRNNSLEGAYLPQSKKKSKGGAGVPDASKPAWGWLSIFRRKPSAQQICASSTTTTSSSSSKTSPTPATVSHGRSGASSAARSTAGHQARSRQPQRQTTTVASARRAAAAAATAAAAAAHQQNSQANARIVLIQVISLLVILLLVRLNYLLVGVGSGGATLFHVARWTASSWAGRL